MRSYRWNSSANVSWYNCGMSVTRKHSSCSPTSTLRSQHVSSTFFLVKVIHNGCSAARQCAAAQCSATHTTAHPMWMRQHAVMCSVSIHCKRTLNLLSLLWLYFLQLVAWQDGHPICKNCLKGVSGKVIADEKGIKDSWKEYMEKLINEENEWDHRVGATVKEWPALVLDVGCCYRCCTLCVCVCVWHTHELWTMTELIDMPLGFWSYVGPRNQLLDWVTYWCHLANTIERFILGSNAGCLYHYCSSLFMTDFVFFLVTEYLPCCGHCWCFIIAVVQHEVSAGGTENPARKSTQWWDGKTSTKSKI